MPRSLAQALGDGGGKERCDSRAETSGCCLWSYPSLLRPLCGSALVCRFFTKPLGPSAQVASQEGGLSVCLGLQGGPSPAPATGSAPGGLATAWGAWFGFLIDSSFLLVTDLCFFMMSLGFSGQIPEL